MSDFFSAVLALGKSGTGKTRTARAFAMTSNLPRYIINGTENDYPKQHFTHIGIDDVAELQAAILIVEDYVRPNDSYVAKLNYLLVKLKRHSCLMTWVNAHHVNNQSLNSLIVHFEYILFSKDPGNFHIFKAYAQKHCPLDYEDSMRAWHQFMQEKQETHSLRFNVRRKRFETVDIRNQVVENTESELRKKVSQYLSNKSHLPDKMNLFDFLQESLPPGAIDKNYRIAIKSNNIEYSCSIMDLLHFCCDDESSDIPSTDINVIFKFLQEHYKIPHLFVLNRQLKM